MTTTKYETTILLACNNCYSTNLEIDDKKIGKTGSDWFICKTCKNKFPLRKASYIKG